jgi:hypothetical protein
VAPELCPPTETPTLTGPSGTVTGGVLTGADGSGTLIVVDPELEGTVGTLTVGGTGSAPEGD